MSKIESSAGKALYEQQETKLSQQSAAFIELLTKRGSLGDSSIDDDRVRQAKKEKKKSMYHNTLLLLQHYRTILWTLECFPSSVAEELDRPLKDLDTLLDRIDLELGMNNRKLEGRMESVRRSRLLVDRLNDAVSILTGQRAQDVRHHLHDLSRTGQADARRASVPSGHLCPALLPAPHAGNQYHRPAPMVCPCRRGGFLAGGSFYFGKLVRLKASIIALLLQERDK